MMGWFSNLVFLVACLLAGCNDKPVSTKEEKVILVPSSVTPESTVGPFDKTRFVPTASVVSDPAQAYVKRTKTGRVAPPFHVIRPANGPTFKIENAHVLGSDTGRVSPRSVTDIFDFAKGPGFHGFLNPGNLCYLNAALQLLSHSTNLKNVVMSSGEHISSMMSAVSVVFKSQWGDGDELLLADPVRRVLASLHKGSFPFGRMEDSHEAIRIVLDSMGRQDLFKIDLVREMKCPHCGNVNTKTFSDMEILLTVPVVDDLTEIKLEGLLKTHWSSETLSGVICASCKEASDRTASFKVTKLPKNLLVVLKRFDNDSNKIDTSIEIPEVFETPDSWRTKNAVYYLVGIVHHSGTAEAGHYYTDFSQDGEWYRGNDSSVTKRTPELAGPSPYILLYQAVTDSKL